MKISRKFATSLDILVAKETNLDANATVLVAISSPASQQPIWRSASWAIESEPIRARGVIADYSPRWR